MSVHRSVEGRRRDSVADVVDGEAGDWCIHSQEWGDVTGPAFAAQVPDGETGSSFVSLSLFPRPDGGPSWSWDGNPDRPTLTPSIGHRSARGTPHADGYTWHGHMVAGRLVGC